jgi:Zn-dependent protease with chaperone function
LGIFGAALGIFGIANAGVALRKASRTVSTWTSAAQAIESPAPVPVLRISQAVPAMIAAGIVHPRVLLSEAAESLLSASELQTALNHEIAHVRRRDNLKKLLLRFVAFPAMKDLETAWLEATEMAADDAAVSSPGEALDLAAALIKLSRLSPLDLPSDLTAALMHSPVSVMNARVARLIAWNDERLALAQKFSLGYAVSATIAVTAVFAVTYSQLLVHVHTATEWLVR